MSTQAKIDYALGEATYAAQQALNIPIQYCEVAKIVLRFLEEFQSGNPFVQIALKILRPGVRKVVVESCGEDDV